MADILLAVNSSVNAIVYGIFSQKYQKMLLKTMHHACGIAPQESIRIPNFGKFQPGPNQDTVIVTWTMSYMNEIKTSMYEWLIN